MERNVEDTGRDKFAHSLLPALRRGAARAMAAQAVAFRSGSDGRHQRGLTGRKSSALGTVEPLPATTLLQRRNA
jgi:hypothetical protein